MNLELPDNVPAFGAPVRHLWGLEEGMDFLNHGSFGACPLPVRAVQRAWQDRLEAQPIRYFVREHGPAVRAAVAELAGFVGAAPERLAFVENATSGVNAVLRSLSFKHGDRIVTTSHVYGAVWRTLEHVTRQWGAELVIVPVPCPTTPEEVLERVETALREGARLALFDHITSASGLILPIEAMVEMCRHRGIPVLVDGAHAPGMVPLDLEALGATWYTGNFHKWLCAPKGSALIWASEEGKVDLHPTVISHGYGKGMAEEFDFTGTRDPSPWLATPAALAFHRWLGPRLVREHNHDFVMKAREILGLEPAGPEEMIGSLAAMRVPGRPDPQRLHDRLWDEHRVELPVYTFQGETWLRVAGQVYNEEEQIHRLANALRRVLA